MYDAKDLQYCLLTELDTPAEAFNMVMGYSKQAKKNPWQCFYEAFNPNYHTVVIRSIDGTYVGYGSGYVTGDDPGIFFLHHGYLCKAVKNKPFIIDSIASIVGKRVGWVIRKVKLTSDWNPRVWHLWGFREDKLIAYEREVNG